MRMAALPASCTSCCSRMPCPKARAQSLFQRHKSTKTYQASAGGPRCAVSRFPCPEAPEDNGCLTSCRLLLKAERLTDPTPFRATREKKPGGRSLQERHSPVPLTVAGAAATAAPPSSTAAPYDLNSHSKAHLTIGTIGHVDHGKTTLTAAITKV